jgi:hypothetical protein
VVTGAVARTGRGWRIAVAVCALGAGSNLVAGVAGGLARLGWSGPRGVPLAFHGLLLVCGFFGTLISLERAVALRQPWGLAAPLLAALGGVLTWAGAPVEQPLVLWLLASIGLLALYVTAAVTRAHTLPLTVEMLGAACWFAGTVMWLQGALAHEAITAWMAFLVLTIAAERRELTQMVRLPASAHAVFKLAVLLLPMAVLLALLEGLADIAVLRQHHLSTQLWWAGCLLLGSWLLRHDLARRHWRSPGWQGLSAQALVLGYAWLLVGAVLGLAERWWPMLAAGPAWHAVLLGFVFAMVFGHAPIILPALARIEPRYTPWLRWPVWILGASLLLRIGASGFGHPVLLAVAGAGHALAIAWYAVVMVRAARQGRAH